MLVCQQDTVKYELPFLIDFRCIQAKHSSNKTTKFVCKDKICNEDPQNGMELK